MTVDVLLVLNAARNPAAAAESGKRPAWAVGERRELQRRAGSVAAAVGQPSTTNGVSIPQSSRFFSLLISRPVLPYLLVP